MEVIVKLVLSMSAGNALERIGIFERWRHGCFKVVMMES